MMLSASKAELEGFERKQSCPEILFWNVPGGTE
jgi:hypothetical protein